MTGAAEPVQRCAAQFEDQNARILAAGVRDYGATIVKGFPWLRADRLLASFANDQLAAAQRRTWVERLSGLDENVRETELARLGKTDRRFSATEREACRSQLIRFVMASDPVFRALRDSTKVPDDYLLSRRVLGLYPLTAPLVLAGVNRWHREARETFATPLSRLPLAGELHRWSSRGETGGDNSHVLLPRDDLGIPVPDDDLLARLFNIHAPVWEVDVADGNDLVGRPVPTTPPDVDAGDPVEYRLVSFTRWRRRVLIQLNYAIWFAARPGDDMYAGALDGLIWRVTLDGEGEPLVYDSIHSCGCYHQFFPRSGLTLRDDPQPGTEPPLVPQQAPPEGPVVVRLASGTHYIERVYTAGEEAVATQLRPAPYANLRAAGLFGVYGLVDGTQRGERFLLWPMGVRSVGAMRQWGRHATAFVGRRHFDDPYLFDRLFREQ